MYPPLVWAGDENICCRCSKVLSIFWEGQGPRMNPGSGKEATASWSDPFWFWEVYVQARETASLLCFSQRLLQEVNPVEHPKALWYAVLKHWCRSHLLKASVPGLQSVWTFGAKQPLWDRVHKNADIQTLKIDFCLKRRKLAIDSRTDKRKHRGHIKMKETSGFCFLF